MSIRTCTAILRRSALLAIAVAAAVFPARGAAQEADAPAIPAETRQAADRLIDAALADSAAWHRLAELVDRFGHRFSGSESLERAIDWILAGMRSDGLENVRGEPVLVPRWVRGRESATLLEPREADLPMLGLGGSTGTPPGGITAEVLVVSSFDELQRRAGEARGRIVLFDVPFTGYGETVRYRTSGAVAAARAGAVASLIRSVGPFSMKTPHTGAMRYEDGVPRIPHAAITVEDAMMLHRLQDRGERVVVRLAMDARTEPDVESRNVVAELRGRERPEEVVVLGGHIDSWDVGQGAMDDAGGSVIAWEAVRLMKDLGLRPRRTVRVVLWTNEENGLRGGTAYRDRHRDALDHHVLAIESDAGVFDPVGFGFTGSDRAFEIVRQVAEILHRIGAGEITRGGGGADIGPIMQLGVPGMGLRVDGDRYFWYHHTDADTLDKLDPREVALCTAAMAVMAYVIADLPEALPR
ncbi:MAG TPA: M28 family metallopeptidase [Longimicrobiales bacterium]|nr:M28 family metallopeptidase [Longimicrobiales bacterium]